MFVNRAGRFISMLTLVTVAALLSAGAASPAMAAPSHDTVSLETSTVTAPATRPAAPAARLGSGCLPQFSYCVVFTRGETETVASGGYTAAVALLAAGCGLIPFPGNIACAGGAALYGPITSEAAKGAIRNGLCLGLTSSTVPATNPLPVPVQAIC